MTSLLKNNEIRQVSGGWVCNSTYDGKTFYKAEWRSCWRDSSKSSGACYYGTKEEELSPYRVSDRVVGIVQKPVNHWTNQGRRAIFNIWACYYINPNDCVFEEK